MTNTLGIHAGVWIGEWTPQSTAEAVRRTKQAGYDLIEVTGSDPASIDTALLRSEITSAGLESTVSLGLAFDADVSSEDAESRRRGQQRLREGLTLAAEIGSTKLVAVLYSALGKYPGPASAASRDHAAGAIRDLATEASALGITVGLEVVNRYESNQFNTASSALRFLDEVAMDNVVVHLDTYHMNIEEGDLTRPVLELGDRLGYVHIGESHRGYLGSGTIDWSTFFRALAVIDYTGPITFESFSSAVVDPSLSNTLAVWRNLWSDNQHLAEHARAFMQGHLVSASTSKEYR